MLFERLARETLEQHQQLEKKLILQMRLIDNVTHYGALLSGFYRYFGALEILVDKYLLTDGLPDYPARRKTLSLQQDLQALQVALPPVAAKNELPIITNHFQALGALYVMEGSTLGGRVISKMIRAQLKWPAGMQGFTFFDGYGAQTGAMWQVFKESFALPISSLEEDIIIKAANETFARFHSMAVKISTT